MSAMGRKQPSALASYQIPRASTITSLPQILFPICHPTTELSGRGRLVNAATMAHGPLEHVVRRHFTPLYAFRNAVSRCTAKDPKPIERVGGKLQGEVTRGELPG